MRKVKLFSKAGAEFVIRHCSLSIILASAVIISINTVVLYYLTPILLNYPPDFDEYFKSQSIVYWFHFVLLAFFCFVVLGVFTRIYVRGIDSWYKIKDSCSPEGERKLAAIRRKCLELPHRLYLYQLSILALIFFIYSVVFSILLGCSIFGILQAMLIAAALNSFTFLLNFLFVKKMSTEIMYRIGVYNRLEGRSVSLRRKLLLQILPVTIVSILSMSILGYSRLMDDRGDILFRLYRTELEKSFTGAYVSDISEIERTLKTIDVDETREQYFILKPNGEFLSSDDSKISRYFKAYLINFSDNHNGRIYDEMMHYNGALIKIQGDEGLWSAGIRYRLTSSSAVYYVEGSLLILLLIVMFIVYLSSKSITSDISEVALALEEIVPSWNIKSGARLPITANDEIGQLILSINKIRDYEHEYDTLKNEFIANISHEFRTPLNIILNALQLSARYIKRSSSEEDASRLFAHIGTMKQNCYRLLKLINNIIDSTKLEANFFRLYRQNRNIVSDIRLLTMSVSDYIKDKKINLVFEANTEKKIIAADPDALERIMLNLLSNAIKFSDPGSTITVRVTDMGETVDISVKDTGVGIPEDKLQSIFKRFTQIDGTLTKSHEGSGIGLSIVKSLVEMHGGRVTVNSRLGEGTEFTVTLPVKLVPIQLEGEGDWELYDNKLQSGIEKIDIELSDI